MVVVKGTTREGLGKGGQEGQVQRQVKKPQYYRRCEAVRTVVSEGENERRCVSGSMIPLIPGVSKINKLPSDSSD